MNYFIRIYGCQMNYSDAERVAAVLEAAGYEKACDEARADLIVFVACAVRESAVERLYGNGKKFARQRRRNPAFRTVLTGCVVKEDRTKLAKIFDHIVDIKAAGELPRLLSGGSDLTAGHADYFGIQPEYEDPFTAYVPVMTGCDNFCSYCIVPYTRGREYSRPAAEVIAEVTRLVAEGRKEIILLGQNVNSYHPDEKTDFPALLEMIDAIEGDFWIRFLTSHPKDLTERLIETVARLPKCTNHIHLALQSGNDRVLCAMNRKYTRAHFLGLVDMIRRHIPDVMLTTDIIVGFPGETEAEFLDTASIMEEARFDIAYINKYSPRAGTASARLTDDVSWNEKKRREKILTDVLRKTALANNESYLGRETEVLIAKTDGDYWHGKTRSFKDIEIPRLDTDEDLLGRFILATITKVTPWALEGEIIR